MGTTTHRIQREVEKYAEGVRYKSRAQKFLNFDRWTGDDPVLLVVDAAGTTTGQSYYNHVKPQTERFKDLYVASGRISSLSELSELDWQSEEFKRVFTSQRKRRVSVKVADRITNSYGDGLSGLRAWADSANPYDYSENPVGKVRGIGLRTFQYLRMLAGVDTIKPDIQVQAFLKTLDETLDTGEIDTSTDKRTLQSCEWICHETDYSLLELDQIAWWNFSTAAEFCAKNSVH